MNLPIPEALTRFSEIFEASLTGWPQRYPGHPAIGYLCSYTPEELIHASGFTPLRLWTHPRTPVAAASHLPAFTCALCRCALDQALEGELDFLAGVVFPHTCDTLQALADIWKHAYPGRPVFTLGIPTYLSSPHARDYLLVELQLLRTRLSALTGQPISEESVRASIGLYNASRRLMAQLAKRRTQLPAASFLAVMGAAMRMPRELYIVELAALVASMESQPVQEPAGPKVFLAGSALTDLTIPRLLDELGATVIDDDLCTSRRYYETTAPTDDEPLSALATLLLQRTPCAAKHDPERSSPSRLLTAVKTSGAQGVIFVIQKFCDPYAFDYALTASALEQTGLPHLLLEWEHHPAIEPLRTRLQAFMEML